VTNQQADRVICRISCVIPAQEQPTFECAVEKEASGADENISAEAYSKDSIMAIFQTISNTSYAQAHEQQVSKGVDNLSRVNGCIVVLSGASGVSFKREERNGERRSTSSHLRKD
jgi:hypothetical protein